MSRPDHPVAVLARHTWTDEVFAGLTTDARLCWLWCLTSPQASLCGLYEATVGQVARGIGTDKASAQRALQELEREQLIHYDQRNEVLLVRKRMQHVAHLGGKAHRQMRREWQACPPSPLRDEFAQRHGDLLQLTGNSAPRRGGGL